MAIVTLIMEQPKYVVGLRFRNLFTELALTTLLRKYFAFLHDCKAICSHRKQMIVLAAFHITPRGRSGGLLMKLSTSLPRGVCRSYCSFFSHFSTQARSKLF